MIRLNRPVCPDPNALITNYKAAVNKAALQQACFDKCMYCESKIPQTYFGDVEHIRPKAKFPTLEFSWENLGYVCARCNGAKSNEWNDAAPLVDPFGEDPSTHLVGVGPLVIHRNSSARGEYTEKLLKLNRPDVVERRKERIDQIVNLIDKAARTGDAHLRALIMQEVQRELADDREYAMVARAAYQQVTA